MRTLLHGLATTASVIYAAGAYALLAVTTIATVGMTADAVLRAL